ncbi:MAG TPA: type 4a pilus biogenesis protein PilO [Bacteriovoracaceae bacterium]|nr:type 4a pilus biogenesis protein PilO [Bacteriovoracaceae bacterium]
MKDLVNNLFSKLHLLTLVYFLYIAYVMYDEHQVKLTEIQVEESTIEQELLSNKAKVKEIQEFLKKADEYKVRVEEVARNIESVQKQLPSETNDSQILTFFNHEMSLLNIKDPSLTPGREQPSTYFVSKEYSLKAKGTFLQFLIFFERISTATRIYNVKQLKLTNITENQKGRFQLINGESIIEAFRFNPEFKVERGFDAAAAPVKQ